MGMLSTLRVLAVLAIVPLLGAAERPARAAPPGRVWSPIRAFVAAGHAGTMAQRFEPTTGGRIELVATGFGGPDSQRTYGFQWRDSAWVSRWDFSSAQSVARVLPLSNSDSIQMLAYSAVTGNTDCWFGVRFVLGDDVTPADSLGKRNCSSFAVSGAATGRRAWASAPEVAPSGVGVLLALRSRPLSDSAQAEWTRIPPPPDGGRARVIASLRALDDSTCLVVWTQDADTGSGLWWGLVGEDRWVRAPEFVQYFNLGGLPIIRSRTADSLLVFYGNTASNSVYRVFSLADRTWGPLVAVYWAVAEGRPTQHYFYETDGSQDDRPLPALSALSYSSVNGVTYAHVSVPDSGRYGMGEFIPGSLGAGSPFVARDENGDVWLAWSRPFPDSVFWLHSYATSTCGPPAIEDHAGQPRLSWTLTERTPESAWRVLRSMDGGPFEPLERVIAKDDLRLAWVDESAPRDSRLRYRVRRECRDVRYIWESGESAEWLPRTPRLGASLRSANPASEEIAVEITGARTESVELRLLDLQGRTVVVLRTTTGGLGRDLVRMSLSGVPRPRPGLYLLHARSSSGAVSPTIKVALLR